MIGEHPTAILDAQVIVCPRCAAKLTFARNNAFHVDECGFESYGLECVACSAALAGIIDPFDDALLVSESAA
jgi:hypothetical protein